MNRKLLQSVREYKKESILAPIFVILEVFMEVLIPYQMAKIIDDGIQLGNLSYYLYGNGAMATGWQEIDGQIYYFYPDGHKAANEWISGFYVDPNGVWNRP